MNLLLLEAHEVGAQGVAVVRGRRARHIREVLRRGEHDSIRAGMIGGKVGVASIDRVEDDSVSLRFEPRAEPPVPLDIRLVLALPRPKVLKRVLANVTSLGIKQIWLINAFRVEKPYWSSEHVTPESIRKACVLGLEQGCDTVLPEVHLEKLFKPFVEDRLPALVKNTRAFVAHPVAESRAPQAVSGPLSLAIGPEGGFIPYEIEKLQAAGFQSIHVGERILTVETAVAFLTGRLAPA